MKRSGGSYYRWYILALTMLTFGTISGASRMCIPVLFKEMSVDLHLNIVAIGTIWGLDPLAGVIISLPAGLFVDRFGLKRTLTIVCILAGIFGALRGFSVNFASLAATTFLFGFMSAMIPGVAPKATAVWFRDRYLGLANALQNVVWYIGSMVGTMFSATVFSPLLGGWRHVVFLYGVPTVIVGLLWLFTGKEPAPNELPDTPVSSVSFRQAFSHVVRMKGVGLIMLTFWGAGTGLNGYLALYLRNIGWTPASADGAITILFGVSCAGVIPMVLLSDRIGSRKAVLILSIISTAVGIGLIPVLKGPQVVVLLIVCNFLKAGTSALLHVLIFEMKEVGSLYAGTAIGLVSTIGMVGSFLAPPLGNSLALINYGLPFIFWAGLSVLGLPLLFLLKEKRGMKS
jgi:MFS family permease